MKHKDTDNFEDESSEEDESSLKSLLNTFQKRDEVQLSTQQSAVISDDDEEEEEEVEENNSDILGSDSETKDEEEEEEETDLQKKSIDDNIENEEEEADEDESVLQDPFVIHLLYDLANDLYQNISSESPKIETHSLQWPTLGNINVYIPKSEPPSTSPPQKKQKILLSEVKQFAQPGNVPNKINKINWNGLHVKSQIRNNLTKANYINIKDMQNINENILTPIQAELFSIINNYQDFLFCERTISNDKEIMFTYCLHVMNHLLKTRSKILHHNNKLSKMNNGTMSEIPEEYRDQGLVRPKVLIIVPFRHSCLKIVEMLIAILFGDNSDGSVMNKKRFLKEYGGETIFMPKTNPKPEDYEITFSGNTDDTFKIGISITKKTLKLYSEFYSSDVIIASPLGLRLLIGAAGEEDRDYDYLASLELLIIDQADILLMQNWDHLIHIMSHLHLQPRKFHGTDFSRVRSWSVNGWSKYYRQTLIFSSIHTPEIHALFNKKCANYAGKIKVMNNVQTGSISQVIVQLPQVFYKFNASSHTQAINTRFDFFIKKILPQYKDSMMSHTLVYIPSYFDYVKLRNYFKKEELNFVQICEYSKDNKIARARDMFFHGSAHFLLYSERFHFFRRIRIKGIKHIIFYAPPLFPNFYTELCNFMFEFDPNSLAKSKSNMTISTLYCKYDAMYLSAVVGTDRFTKMIASDKSTHTIITGN
ncbi:digestive organ expansion factor homolog [Chelonus insularis]|uniref:digestive organ expansion factor homolog n=1 Tax=Chelonus insularis TaxID=460826 RepID=UPI00158D022D|nr:digestive organ expansion factor homolog [Chelonus insularis]